MALRSPSSSIPRDRCSDEAPGDSRPKAVVAREALEAMLDATEALVAKRPDFAVKVGIYSFSSDASTVLPIQAFDRVAIRDALARLPAAGRRHGHRRGDAHGKARPVSCGCLPQVPAGCHGRRKYLRAEAQTRSRVKSFKRANSAVQIYFVAFDTSAESSRS